MTGSPEKSTVFLVVPPERPARRRPSPRPADFHEQAWGLLSSLALDMLVASLSLAWALLMMPIRLIAGLITLAFADSWPRPLDRQEDQSRPQPSGVRHSAGGNPR